MKRLLIIILFAFAMTQGAEAKKPEVRNIIFMIGDGMGMGHISMLQIEGKYAPTAFDKATNVALIKTNSANNRVTDSAAAGTAMACGVKTNNGRLGMTPDEKIVESIMDKAKANNYETGLVVSYYLQHATPAAFYAHVKSRGEIDNITDWFVKSDIDVAFGGGKKYFRRYYENKKLDYTKELTDLGYIVLEDMNKIDSLPVYGKVLAMLSDGNMPSIEKGREGYLAKATKKALQMLCNNSIIEKRDGFVLMVEGSQIDGRSHSNDPSGILSEMRDFEDAIKMAMAYADHHEGTLVVITSDHETGGMSIPSNKTDFTLPESGISYSFGTTSHTGTMVPVFFYGAGAEKINGVMDNTELCHKLQELIGLSDKAKGGKTK